MGKRAASGTTPLTTNGREHGRLGVELVVVVVDPVVASSISRCRSVEPTWRPDEYQNGHPALLVGMSSHFEFFFEALLVLPHHYRALPDVAVARADGYNGP